jgi:hypothetical protein
MSTRALALALFGLTTLACGDASEPDKPASTKAETKAKTDEPDPVAAKPDVGTAAPEEKPAEAVDPEVAAIDPDEPLPEPEEVPHAETAFLGPCKVTWSTGAKLTFTYEGEGGTVKVDSDSNGKPDACGTFTSADGKTTKVEIDDGCDGSVENTIEPAYDAKGNVATATFTDGDKSRDITLIEVAGFTGLTPGYPIYAKRKDAKVYMRQGLARKATIKKPWQGEPMTVTFGYNKAGQLERIKEDHGSDGTTDRRLDYRHDDQGNVVAMSVTLGNGDTVQKGRARLDYSCHAKP